MQFMINYWYFIVIALMSAACFWQSKKLEILNAQNRGLEASVKEYKLKLDISNKSIEDLSASINAQNAAVESLKLESNKRQKSAEIAISQARDQNKELEKLATSLLIKNPLADKTLCESADALFNEEIQHAK